MTATLDAQNVLEQQGVDVHQRGLEQVQGEQSSCHDTTNLAERNLREGQKNETADKLTPDPLQGATCHFAAASGEQGRDPREFAETEASSAGTRGSETAMVGG
ncbi:hypothetical protein [Actinacidiphila sp. bgisy144]|uniref:hypothetical protein n=1 Tax=unclassified Actinacidiphila TaxID=2995708 RepID=UPI003EB8BE88